MVNHVQHDSGIKVPIQHIISSENVKICKELGAGEFGIVEQGILTDKNKTHQVIKILPWENEFRELSLCLFRLQSKAYTKTA